MDKRSLRLAAILTLLLLGGEAVAGPKRPAPASPLDRLMDSLFAVRTFGQVALSPDGSRLAWVEALPGKDQAPSDDSAIYVLDLRSGSAKPCRVTAGNDTAAHAEHDMAWSPDGSRLAFLSDRQKKGQLQVYVAAAAGGRARQLTRVTGLLADPRWSPNGKRLAVLFTENAPRAAGPLQPAAPAVGVIEEHVYEQRLSTVDLDSGRVQAVSPADLYVYEYDWSPDGKSLAALAAHGSGDNNWYIARLYTLALAAGEMKAILTPAMQLAVPRWSPDGKTIAFIGGLMSDEGATGGDIYTVSATGGAARNLTPGMKASASWLTWLPSSDRILFTEHVDGCSGIATLDLSSGRVATLWTGAETISGAALGVSLSRGGKTCALVRHSFEHPPEVWVGPVGAWKQVTHANRDVQPRWGAVRSLHWKSDGFTVQGWLLYPRHYRADRHYPMVVSVHGGPAWLKRPAWPGTFFDLGLLSHEGYFVFLPNPRGSYGQGEKFTRANVKDFGYGDQRDILAGVDEVLKTVPVDRDRLAISGWSYGGYMTMWAVTQTHRFRAAVAGAGIANWQSYYGQNGIDQWLIPYFGASVYDDPAVYARSSPITFIKQVRTPTLILVGEGDVECPVPQSYEFWHALKTLGVKTQFVVYANEGHRIARPRHRRDIMRRTVGWLNANLKANSAADTKANGQRGPKGR
ncbi:MAG TPA: S9 family peptidase [Gemmataceae bacterium]|nr:S9 family peptidase [Gemmataceae bacterium]